MPPHARTRGRTFPECVTRKKVIGRATDNRRAQRRTVMNIPPLPSLLAAAQSARDRGDYLAGRACAEQAVQLAREARDGASEGQALALAAFHCARLRDAESSVRAGRRALPLLRAANQRTIEVDTLVTLAFANNNLGMHSEGLRHASAAVEGASELGDELLSCWALNRSAAAYEGLSDFDKALRFMEQAVEAARRTGNDDALFGVLNNQGNVLASRSEAQEAAGDQQGAQARWLVTAQCYQAALVVAERLVDRGPLTLCLVNVAPVYARVGRFDDAEQACTRAHGLAVRDGRAWLMPMLLETQATVTRLRGDDDAFIEQALTLFRDHPETMRESGHKSMADLYRALKRRRRFEEALHWCEEMVRVERETLRQRADAQSRLLMEQLDVEQAQREAKTARAALRTEIDRTAQLDSERRALAAQAAALDIAAHVDVLTGLPNRRYIDQKLALLMQSQRRADDVLCVALVDVDHFKSVNDRFGHPAGDEVLRTLARLFGAKLRGHDVAARQGGEEFLLVLSGAPPPTAQDVCERLREAVQAHDWAAIAPGLAVTISIGVCGVAPGDSVASLMKRVDAALYRAKNEGRNRVLSAD
jgi:diguanylate cyclase (GGDEF)-like protein